LQQPPATAQSSRVAPQAPTTDLPRPRPVLSLIVPAYNEGRRIGASLRAMSAYLGAVGYSYEIIVVDDGSIDDTATVLAAAAWHPGSSQAVPPPLVRRLMGSVFRWCVHRLVISDVRDTQCGCKAYRADASRRLFALSQIDRFSFDAEVIFLAGRLGYRIAEVPFALRHVPGSSVRPVRDSLLMLRDLLRIRLNALRGGYGRLGASRRVGQVS
jgi:glycosyltransferase involved in cell wall biosynthesis